MITPTQIAIKPKAISVLETEYNFPSQQREGNTPIEARFYTYNSMQTYSSRGYPVDSQGDNWD